VNAATVVVVLVALLCTLKWVRWSPRDRWRRGHIDRLAPRFVRRRQRQRAFLQAWELTQAIIADRPDPLAHLAAGVILQSGEDVWTRARARLAVRTSQAAWTAYTQVSWLGRRAKNVTRATASEHWRGYGEIEWLITSQRIVGRLPASSVMISVWWSGLDGVDIYIESDRIVFNGVNGWTGMLSGPAVVPIAVAAIAMCHGLEALLVHPALEALRQQGAPQPPPQQPSSSREPETIGAGGTILRLPTRPPTR
jgi:hypothetical protein